MTPSPLPIGCQSITFGDGQRDFLPDVFQTLADGGYMGVEIGFRHIQPTPAAELKRQLDDHGLTLIASHIGGNLEDTQQAAGERAILEEILDYLNALGAGRLMYSGLKYQDDEQFAQDLAMLQKSEQRCRERGVRLLYHNHAWEFADDGRVMETLIRETEIGFCPDIGWVMKGGADAASLLDRLGERVGALHMKDFATPTPGRLDTVMLGEGVAPLRDAATWAATNDPELWLIAEQDKADTPPEQAVTRNAEFLRSIAIEASDRRNNDADPATDAPPAAT